MKHKRIWVVTAAVIITAFGVVIALNFAGPARQVERRIGHRYPLDSPQFTREMGVLLGPGILGGNSVEALQNGDEIFPAMLAAIDSAETTITFETYIYWSGEIGDRFSRALARKAREGVAVKVLLDWVGSAKMDGAILDSLRASGASVEQYRPLAWYTLSRLNNRTHRKLLVVDGRVGFTGGVGIADVWTGDAQDPEHWRDIHFRVEGPVVGQLQAAFMDNWIETTGEVLNGPDYFPPLESTGGVPAQMFTSSPAGGSDSMRLMYLMAIAAAERTLDLNAAYFVPDQLILGALVAAQERGVRVRILVPGEHLDSELVALSSKRSWGPLLQAGVAIAEYEPTMIHTKMLIIDGEMVSVGSTNFDIRSFELNDEASLNLYDRDFAQAMTEVFEADFAQGRAYTYAMWENRPWGEKFAETVLIPIKSQL
ncbi:phospholipase D-like domain-containing protein [Rubricoccus marinus]|uniref:Cardiolipin synthase B n=1 Tax=Rubricoccus marinus TaxID=716817 RepID=A0A259U3Q1_9BACT|nr:phospholipase D-like domain-containing protein [Rubricoccus marinus]OZC04454.1 cardiolipin synthase B [Rubricoccus marinus]